MKLFGISALVSLALNGVFAADVTYSVIAFPQGNQQVGVSVGGKTVQLEKSTAHENIFTGTAPFGSSYQYVIVDGQNNTPESYTRSLADGATSTGNEFFNRSKTVYDVPKFPQAYNPVYPTLYSSMDSSNEIATIIVTVDPQQLAVYNKDPEGENHKYAQVPKVTYINNKEIYSFENAGLKTSGQSTKEFAKQSWTIKLNKFNKNATEKNLLFGRTQLKLRAEESDASFAREKLAFDMLAASGAATLSGSWVRLYMNGEAYGLFLLIDAASTHFIDSVLYGGNWDNPSTGVTYKGNALSPTEEGNLVYLGNDSAKYNEDLYKLTDKGKDKSYDKKNKAAQLIDFTKRLSEVDPSDAKDAQNPGSIAKLIDSTDNTLRHMAINFLSGSYDGFWYKASNYYLNEDSVSKKWTLISYDFDETYGINTGGKDIDAPYQNFTRAGGKRPLIDAFLNNEYYAKQFEEVVKTIAKRFFKPSIVNARLEAWYEMLKEDIAWTRSIDGRSPGKKTNFNLENFRHEFFGNTSSSTSITQWVERRSATIKQQLNFDDKDDLPPLPAYTEGTHFDSNGNVVKISTANSNNHTDANTPNSAAGGNSQDNNSGGTTTTSNVDNSGENAAISSNHLSLGLISCLALSVTLFV